MPKELITGEVFLPSKEEEDKVDFKEKLYESMKIILEKDKNATSQQIIEELKKDRTIGKAIQVLEQLEEEVFLNLIDTIKPSILSTINIPLTKEALEPIIKSQIEEFTTKYQQNIMIMLDTTKPMILAGELTEHLKKEGLSALSLSQLKELSGTLISMEKKRELIAKEVMSRLTTHLKSKFSNEGVDIGVHMDNIRRDGVRYTIPLDVDLKKEKRQELWQGNANSTQDAIYRYMYILKDKIMIEAKSFLDDEKISEVYSDGNTGTIYIRFT